MQCFQEQRGNTPLGEHYAARDGKSAKNSDDVADTVTKASEMGAGRIVSRLTLPDGEKMAILLDQGIPFPVYKAA